MYFARRACELLLAEALEGPPPSPQTCEIPTGLVVVHVNVLLHPADPLITVQERGEASSVPDMPAGGVHTPGLEPPLIHRQSLVGLAELALQDVHPPLVHGTQALPFQNKPLSRGQTLQEGGFVAPLLQTGPGVHPPLLHATQRPPLPTSTLPALLEQLTIPTLVSRGTPLW